MPHPPPARAPPTTNRPAAAGVDAAVAASGAQTAAETTTTSLPRLMTWSIGIVRLLLKKPGDASIWVKRKLRSSSSTDATWPPKVPPSVTTLR